MYSVTPGVANDLPTVSVSGPLPGGTTPPKNVRSNMMDDSGFPDIDLMSDEWRAFDHATGWWQRQHQSRHASWWQ
jgi:hypothetical protein